MMHLMDVHVFMFVKLKPHYVTFSNFFKVFSSKLAGHRLGYVKTSVHGTV